MISRRRFLTGVATALAPMGATAHAQEYKAQQAGKVHRIGMLETRSAVLNAANVDAFRGGLQELGYKEGQNIEIVYRSSDGRDERFPTWRVNWFASTSI